MVFGVFLLELRAVVLVETGVVSDDSWIWLWERWEDGIFEPSRDFGD